jgi:hypothetical protein
MCSPTFLLNEETGRNGFAQLITDSCKEIGATVKRVEADGNVTLEISADHIFAIVRVWRQPTGPLTIEWITSNNCTKKTGSRTVSKTRVICDDQAHLIELLASGLSKEQLVF